MEEALPSRMPFTTFTTGYELMERQLLLVSANRYTLPTHVRRNSVAEVHISIFSRSWHLPGGAGLTTIAPFSLQLKTNAERVTRAETQTILGRGRYRQEVANHKAAGRNFEDRVFQVDPSQAACIAPLDWAPRLPPNEVRWLGRVTNTEVVRLVLWVVMRGADLHQTSEEITRFMGAAVRSLMRHALTLPLVSNRRHPGC